MNYEQIYNDLIKKKARSYWENSFLSYPQHYVEDIIDERFISYDQRKEIRTKRICDDRNFIYSQGSYNRTFTWKGIPIYKTVYDLALYQCILADIKPNTIIELGTGDGGSCIWFQDILQANDVDAKIITIDIENPVKYFSEIQYVKLDVSNIHTQDFSKCKHPWIVIEDCHVHLLHILKTFDMLVTKGDYIIIEDNSPATHPMMSDKPTILDEFMNNNNKYLVDIYYTDFYGYNNCSFSDSLFKVMQK